MTTMQRWELSAFGREVLSLVSVPRPVPGADEVLVEVEAVPLNFRDSLIMENRLGWRAPSGWSTG
jgi:NADPH:quinone reductase-like Zn-dependent oxidoreductase